MPTLINEIETAQELADARAAYNADRNDTSRWERVHRAAEAYLEEVRATLADSVHDDAFMMRERPRGDAGMALERLDQQFGLERVACLQIRMAADYAGRPPWIMALELAMDLSDDEFTTPLDSVETRYTALARIAEWAALQYSIAPSGESA